MFEQILTIISIISLIIVVIIAFVIVGDHIRKQKTNESLRKWLISAAVVFIGSAFIAKAVNDQNSKNSTSSDTLTMKVLDADGKSVPKSDGSFQINGKNNQATTFTVQTNRSAKVNYTAKDGAKVNVDKLSNTQYKLIVDGSDKKQLTIYISAAVIGQRIGSNVSIENK